MKVLYNTYNMKTIWMLVMVTIVDGQPVAKTIDTYDAIAKCYAAKTLQEFDYNFDTMRRDWVCVRLEGKWDYLLRY